ncbi:hypothetical protein ACT3UA_16120 [Glutamicibacter sp. 363]|uniref:hypothetical protein n=1 Tax=Glutamicibacter sp. 363 TaxID=3457731 RepID=UPI0040334F3B
MDENEFSFANLEFIFAGSKPEAAADVHAVLAEHRLVGSIDGARSREHATEVLAELATLNDARDPVLCQIGPDDALVQGPRLTELAHNLKAASGARFVLINGEELDGPVPGEEQLGQYAPDVQLFQGATLKVSDLTLSPSVEGNTFTVFRNLAGLTVLPRIPLEEPNISRSSRPYLELTRSGSVLTAAIHSKGPLRPQLFPDLVSYQIDLERMRILQASPGSDAQLLLNAMDEWNNAVFSDDYELVDQLLAAGPAREEAKSILRAPRSANNLKRFLTLHGYDPRSIDFVSGAPVPEDAREIHVHGVLDSIRVTFEEFEREATGLMGLLSRTGWSPRALIFSSVAVLAAGAMANRAMKTSPRLSRVPQPLRRGLMFFWYSDGLYYLARGVKEALEPKLQKAKSS